MKKNKYPPQKKDPSTAAHPGVHKIAPVAHRALIVGTLPKSETDLIHKLKQLSVDVTHEELPLSFSDLFSWMPFDLVILSDSIKPQLVGAYRPFFPKSKIVYLFQRLSMRAEITLRSHGLIFLGSYDHFRVCMQDILRSAFKTRHSLDAFDLVISLD